MSKYAGWKQLEREIRRDLEDAGYEAKRLWDVQFEEGGGVDVLAKPFAVQCKYGSRPPMKQAWKEAKKAMPEMTPVAVCRFKGEKTTLAVLSWKDLLSLVKQLKSET